MRFISFIYAILFLLATGCTGSDSDAQVNRGPIGGVADSYSTGGTFISAESGSTDESVGVGGQMVENGSATSIEQLTKEITPTPSGGSGAVDNPPPLDSYVSVMPDTTVDMGGVGGTTPSTDSTFSTNGTAPADGTYGDAGFKANDPIIPEVTGDCPNFRNGPLNFMGLSGLIVAEQKGSGDGVLLFYWHGTYMPASRYVAIGLNNVSRITSNGGLIVSIEGPASGEAGGICSGTMIFGDTLTWDIVDQIVACAVRDYDIDPRRIYSTGCSAGGLQTGCMALKRSNYVAAVATNSGGLTFPQRLQDATRIPAVITSHGAPGVDVVAVDFSSTSKTFDDVVKNAGGFVVNCNHMGTHCGIPADNYSAAIDFLLDHPFGMKPSPYEAGLPTNFPEYCKIY